MKSLIIKPAKDKSIHRKHPWVFSGAVQKIHGQPSPGDIVTIQDSNGNFLGRGHYQPATITARILTFEDEEIDARFWNKRLVSALRMRERMGFMCDSETTTGTNCFRLVHGDGDGLSGLILDWYNGILVFQAHSIGMSRSASEIVTALKELLGDKLLGVYDKSSSTVHSKQYPTSKDDYLYRGKSLIEELPDNWKIHENGVPLLVNWETGQKTGFFLDQRDNRELVGKLADGCRVLNTYSYTGGFSLYALKGGAKQVVSVDSSQKALVLGDRAISNLLSKDTTSFEKNRHTSIRADVMDYLTQQNNHANPDSFFDIIILDPPAFAKHKDSRHRAIQAYRRLNERALRILPPEGLLFTFSCSQVVTRDLFEGAVTAAAIDTGRRIRILKRLSQPADHPVNIFHPEGEYLKGLLLQVE